jgi:predicted ATPase
VHGRRPSELLHELVEQRGWLRDSEQAAVATALDALHDQCCAPMPPPPPSASSASATSWLAGRSFFSFLPSASAPKPETTGDSSTPRPNSSFGGVYIYGPVGTGKTALMDVCLEACALAGVPTRRLHFHQARAGR